MMAVKEAWQDVITITNGIENGTMIEAGDETGTETEAKVRRVRVGVRAPNPRPGPWQTTRCSCKPETAAPEFLEQDQEQEGVVVVEEEEAGAASISTLHAHPPLFHRILPTRNTSRLIRLMPLHLAHAVHLPPPRRSQRRRPCTPYRRKRSR